MSNMTNDIQRHNEDKWYYNDWFVIAMLLVFLPIGIILAIKSPNIFPWKKLLIGIGIVVVLMIYQLMPKSSGSIYGRYDLETESSGMKEILDKYNAYILLTQDGTITLHSETSGFIVHREGTFRKEEGTGEKKVVHLYTQFNDGGAPHYLKINEDGTLKIGSAVYSK